MWNRTWNPHIRALLQQWHQLGLHFRLDRHESAEDSDVWWHLLAWADNFFVLANSPHDLQQKINTIIRKAAAIGQELKPASLEFVQYKHSQRLHGQTPYLHLALGLKATRETHFVALGVSIDAEGSTQAATQHRITQATHTWHNARTYLVNRHLSFNHRLRAYSVRCGNSALYRAGGWHPTQANLKHLQRWDTKHSRAIWGGN